MITFDCPNKCCCENWCQSECSWLTLTMIPSNKFCSKSVYFLEDLNTLQIESAGTSPIQFSINAQPLHADYVTICKKATGTGVSGQTIHNCLRPNNICCFHHAARPPSHRTTRYHWCTHHLWWGSVLFTDKSSFSLKFSDGQCYIYRHPEEHFAHVTVK